VGGPHRRLTKARLAASEARSRTQASPVEVISTPAGVVVNEYVSSAGTVLAVSWRGPRHPDLALLLGPYFPSIRPQRISPPPAGMACACKPGTSQWRLGARAGPLGKSLLAGATALGRGRHPVRLRSFVTLATLMGCGSSGGEGGRNVLPVTVGAGPANVAPAQSFTSVKICAPGTSNCQTIDGVQIDTGSTGLRILASALTLTLLGQTDASGNAIAECEMFSDALTWGPIQTADVQLGGETAPGVAVQVIGMLGFVPPPGNCAASGLPSADAFPTLGANGIRGLGLGAIDCGSPCAGAGNPGLYYSCPSGSGCVVKSVAESAQVRNPVILLPADQSIPPTIRETSRRPSTGSYDGPG
jgi:Protein of unknown function (DUF3443)/Protein of unknown function (DUF2844)